MRLWTLHPRYLDRQGLTAAWREGLLAQAVLAGHTRGYRHHPQLARFQTAPDPLAAVAAYLAGVAEEAGARGYTFQAGKILAVPAPGQILTTSGQLAFEWSHLLNKLATRSAAVYKQWKDLPSPEPHPLFRIVPGPVEPWERAA